MPICDCFHGFRGEFCEVEFDGKYSLMLSLWFIVLLVMGSLILGHLYYEYQAIYILPTTYFRFVDILNGAQEGLQ